MPYLQGRPDPYDGISPVHNWKVGPLSRATVASRLSGLFTGKLKQIHVIRRGVSPRIVYARVVGSSGSSKVTGTTLRDRLNLMDSWISFGKNETGVPARRGHHAGGGGGGGNGGGHHGGGHHGATAEASARAARHRPRRAHWSRPAQRFSRGRATCPEP